VSIYYCLIKNQMRKKILQILQKNNYGDYTRDFILCQPNYRSENSWSKRTTFCSTRDKLGTISCGQGVVWICGFQFCCAQDSTTDIFGGELSDVV